MESDLEEDYLQELNTWATLCRSMTKNTHPLKKKQCVLHFWKYYLIFKLFIHLFIYFLI